MTAAILLTPIQSGLMGEGTRPGGGIPWLDKRVAAGILHYMSLVVAYFAILRLSRNLWFFYDEWDFLSHPEMNLFAPHNEHWSTIPILVFRGVFAVFQLHSYVPYMAVLLLLHVAIAHVLWRLMRAAGADPLLATALAGMFLVLGAGSENILWAFQMGFLGALLFGLIGLWIAEVGGRGLLSVAGIVAACLASLMCSGIAVPMVVVIGVDLALQRRFRDAIVVVAISAAAYVAWFEAYGKAAVAGHHLGVAEILSLPDFVLAGLISTMTTVFGGPALGLVVALLTVAALVVAGRVGGVAPPLLAMLVGVILVFLVIGAGRAGLGNDYARQSRYMYVAAALLLPAIGLGLTVASRLLVVRALPVGLALSLILLAISGMGGARQLVRDAHDRSVLRQESERRILAGVRLLESGAPLVGDPAFVRPEPAIAPQLSAAGVRAFISEGAMPPLGDVSEHYLLTAAGGLQLSVALLQAPPTRSQPVEAVVVGSSEDEVLPAGAGSLDGRQACGVLHPTGPQPQVRLTLRGRSVIQLTPARKSVLQIFLARDQNSEAVMSPTNYDLPTAGANLNSTFSGSAILVLPPGVDIAYCGISPGP